MKLGGGKKRKMNSGPTPVNQVRDGGEMAETNVFANREVLTNILSQNFSTQYSSEYLGLPGIKYTPRTCPCLGLF